MIVLHKELWSCSSSLSTDAQLLRIQFILLSISLLTCKMTCCFINISHNLPSNISITSAVFKEHTQGKRWKPAHEEARSQVRSPLSPLSMGAQSMTENWDKTPLWDAKSKALFCDNWALNILFKKSPKNKINKEEKFKIFQRKGQVLKKKHYNKQQHNLSYYKNMRITQNLY